MTARVFCGECGCEDGDCTCHKECTHRICQHAAADVFLRESASLMKASSANASRAGHLAIQARDCLNSPAVCRFYVPPRVTVESVSTDLFSAMQLETCKLEKLVLKRRRKGA